MRSDATEFLLFFTFIRKSLLAYSAVIKSHSSRKSFLQLAKFLCIHCGTTKNFINHQLTNKLCINQKSCNSYLVVHSSCITKTRLQRYNELALKLQTTCLPHKDKGNPALRLSQRQINLLASLFSTVFLYAAKQGSSQYQFSSHWFDPAQN